MSCKHCCCHLNELQMFPSTESSRSVTQGTGMALRVCALLAVVIVITHHTEGRMTQRASPLMFAMEPDFEEPTYNQPDQSSSQEMQNLMLQMVHRTGMQNQQRLLLKKFQSEQQKQKELDEIHQEEAAADFDSNALAPPDDFGEELSEADKRGSYMSLCHFKICNMGRKRSALPKPLPWSRY